MAASAATALRIVAPGGFIATCQSESRMSFAFGLIYFIFGTALIALCLLAIPGRGGESHSHAAPRDHGPAH